MPWCEAAPAVVLYTQTTGSTILEKPRYQADNDYPYNPFSPYNIVGGVGRGSNQSELIHKYSHASSLLHGDQWMRNGCYPTETDARLNQFTERHAVQTALDRFVRA